MSLDRGSIEDCAVAESASKNTWTDMTEFAKDYYSSLEFFQALNPIEDEFREMYFHDVPEAKTKNGKWKKTYKNSAGERVYILPNAWQTSKSVAGKAIDAKVDMHGKGQTAVAKEARETLSSPIDPGRKAINYMKKALNITRESGDSIISYDKEMIKNYAEAIMENL